MSQLGIEVSRDSPLGTQQFTSTSRECNILFLRSRYVMRIPALFICVAEELVIWKDSLDEGAGLSYPENEIESVIDFRLLLWIKMLSVTLEVKEVAFDTKESLLEVRDSLA